MKLLESLKELFFQTQTFFYKIYFHCHSCGKGFNVESHRELYNGEQCKYCSSKDTEVVDWEKL